MSRAALVPALLVFLLLPCLSSYSAHADPEGIPIQYMDSHGRRPSGFAETPLNGLCRGPYERELVTRTGIEAGARAGEVVLLVDAMVLDGIQAALDQFRQDLEADGYTVLIWEVSGGTAADVRDDLIAQYAGGELLGAICLGDIPTGWMESGYGEYPVDVFLMDMNGTWTDNDGDGLYDSWSNHGPEIWIGRLTPTSITTGSSVELLNGYLARDHAYRNGSLQLPDRALAYEEAFTGLTSYLGLLYDDVTTKSDPVETCADDFKDELLYGYEWVHLIAHSSPWGSSFHTGAPPSGAGTLNSFEVPALDPHASFYVLNCCSNGRWTELDNLANSYIWCEGYGLAALAQAKVDYTNDFQEYYSTLSQGSCLGEAFVDWLSANMSMEHAAVLLGDPTLRPRISADLSSSRLEEGGARPPAGGDAWFSSPLTDGLHTQGWVDTWSDPSSGEVFAVCNTSEAARANILATHSNGDTWIEPVIVCEHEYWDWHPAVAGDGSGGVWIAWQSMRENHETYDIFVSAWTGSGWTSETQVTSGDPFEVEPSMAGGGGHAWIVWQKWTGGSSDLEGCMWTGTTWTTPAPVASSAGSERNPDLSYGSGRFGLVYAVPDTGTGWEIRFRDAPDSGPYGDESTISTPSEESRFPALACDDAGRFWAVWQGPEGSVVSSHETAPGSAWTAPEVLSGVDGGALADVAALQSGAVMAA
ncbi:hypothetical protein JW921_10760, partial [Candidatus Fermentibacterales bacterium]|nr:hypothetical protein [Candidatus Fermentibacterales bacterium]